MLHGFPGISGLGQCCFCGKSFVVEVMMNHKVAIIEIEGIDGELSIHQKCRDALSEIAGTGWENLPDGPLRTAYAEAAAEPEENQPDERGEGEG